MKKYLILLFAFSFISSSFAENWKGNTVSSPIEIGTMAGMSLYGSKASWSWLGTGAYLIEPKGWIDDIDDRLWVELELGPTFFSQSGSNQTGMQYAAHLRWDFTMDENWTFYALGGIGGYHLPTAINGGGMTVNPRFGVGAEYQTKLPLMFRMELSHEFLGAGVAFNF